MTRACMSWAARRWVDMHDCFAEAEQPCEGDDLQVYMRTGMSSSAVQCIDCDLAAEQACQLLPIGARLPLLGSYQETKTVNACIQAAKRQLELPSIVLQLSILGSGPVSAELASHT